MRWTLLVFYPLLFLLPAWGQTYYARYHTFDDSRSNARIQLSFACSSGLLLFGSDQGLYAYDGLSFTLIEIPDSLRLNKVTALGEDAQHNIWVGYDNGAVLKMPALTRELQVWNIEEGWPAAAITGFAFDDSGQMWMGTYGEGVYCYRDDHLYNFDDDDGLPALDVYALVSDENGNIVVGTDGGVSICKWIDGQKNIRNVGLEDGLPDIIVNSLVVDREGTCWAGTYEGGPVLIQVEDARGVVPKAPWPGGTITGMATSPDGTLWIGTEADGVLQYVPRTSTYQDRISSGKIYDLLIDQEGNLWMMDTQHGLSSRNLQFRYLYPGVSHIQTVLQDDDRGIWLGTKEGLYYAPAGDSATLFRAWPNADWNIISLYQDDAQNIWIGTFGEGLYVLSGASKTFHRFGSTHGLQNTNILAIHGDANNLWLGTLGGVYHLSYQPAAFAPDRIQFQAGQSTSAALANYIYSLQKHNSEKVWLGTDGDGLSYWKAGQVKQFDVDTTLLEESVYSLAKDNNGHLLFNSSVGLFRLTGTGLEGSYLPPHLSPSDVAAIWPGQEDNLFIVHNNGITKWIEQDSIYALYTDAVGLENFSPTLNGIEYARGELIIAASQYLVFLQTDFPAERTQAKPIITRVAASLENIPLSQTKPLAAHQSSLAFEVTGIWYTDPDAIRYQYRMIGFDQDWIQTVNQRIVYSKLPPGEYIFEIAASANSDFSHALIDRFSFKIRAPLWQRAWFVVLLISVLFASLSLFIKQREARLERTALLKRDSVESKYETLKSQINPHFLFNSFNTLVAIIEEEPKQAVTYVEKLADFYRSILQYRERDLIPLQEELSIVSDYLFLLKERYGENLSINLPANGEDCLVAPLSLQMLCENAVKHNIISRVVPLTIRLYRDEHDYLWVENKLQKKLGNEKSTGTGLQNISSRYALLTNRPVEIQESEGYFRVGIPLIRRQVI